MQDPIAAPGADPERQEQQDWAARFLRDKMERINNQTARCAAANASFGRSTLVGGGWEGVRPMVQAQDGGSPVLSV